MNKAIQTDRAPAAIGPYSQAIATEKLLFISGQIPLDPGTGKLVDGSIGEQTRRVMKNLQAICKEAECELNDIVKTTIFLTDLSNFQEVNTVYGEFFQGTPPARATIGVAALPLNAAVEIEAIAAIK